MKIPPLLAKLSSHITMRSSNFLLEVNLLKNRRLQQIGDQPVSRRSEPSSRDFLIGEQPNPWELLHPQDKSSRHRDVIFLLLPGGSDYIFFLSQQSNCDEELAY